ncbi:MAG: ATP-binding protein [Gammaproteobacteria bacterium]
MRFGKLRLRAILALLVLTTSVPLGLFAGILIVRSSHEQRAFVEQRNVETARAVSVAVDQHVESARAALQALAATDVLTTPQRITFNEVALRLVPTQPGWYAVLLVHPSGAVMADTALGDNDIPSFTTADWVQRVVRTKQPTVSNLFQDATAGGHFFVVAVPVVRGGEVRSVLAAQIRSTSLSEILRRQSAPPNGVMAVVDSAPVIMARTRGEPQFVGKPPSKDFQEIASRMSEGSWRSTMLEGTPAYSSMSRSPLTGWTVGIGIPAEDMEAPIRSSVLALVLVGALILAIGVACALVLSSFIVRAMAGASGAARALARGERVIAQPSRIVEAERLSTGLLEAATILDARIRERDQALFAERVARSASEKDEVRLSVTLRSIGDAVITTDPAGHVTLLNPVAQALTGWTEAAAIGQPVEHVFHIVQEDTRKPVANPVSKVFREGRIVGLANHTVLLSRDGRETPIEDSAAPIRAADGSLIGIVLVFRDASERREAERRRQEVLDREQEARRAAETLSRSKDDFVATVSHELRTPLNAIFGWVRLLRSGNLNDTQRAHALEVVERNTRAQAQLIEDLLDMSRVVTGHLRLDLRRVELQGVIQAAVDAVKPASEAKELQIAIDADPSVGPISGDPDRLQQIVWNLLTNSVKFTNKGGRIDVSLTSQGSDCVLCVKDTGIGMSPELIPHIFERFHQGASSASRAHGGLGIGLALVRHLVEMHGGTVEATSDGEGHGSMFVIRVPMLGTRAVADRPVLSAVDASGFWQGVGVLAGVSVVVVDDDKDARDLISTTLTHAGASVLAAASMVEALNVLRSATPQALVSDIAMPNGTGYELIREVRQIPHLAKIPAIALTAFGRVEDRERALTAGFNYHITKPVDPQHLVRAVVTALRG